MTASSDVQRQIAEAFACSRGQGADDEAVALLTEVERRRLETILGANANSDTTIAVLTEALLDVMARLRRLELLLDAQGAANRAGLDVGGQSAQACPLAPEQPLNADAWFPPASGFHLLEHDAGGAFRWTGPSHEFRLDVALDRTRDRELDLRLAGAMRRDQLDGLALHADGRWVPLQIIDVNGETIARFVLPATPRAGATALTFVVPYVLRPADREGGGDWRPLGVRFRSLAFAGE